MTVATLPPKEFIDLIGGGFAEVGRSLFDLIVEKCEVTPTDHILDIGSGCGHVAIPFTEYLTTGKYDGFDVVLPMVEWCSQNITAKYPHFNFQYASLTNTVYSKDGDAACGYVFPFESDTFDIVFATSVFTHLVTESARQYAKEIARVLKPSGRALLTFFILNDHTRAKKAAGVGIMPFSYNRGGCFLESEEIPEAAVAFEQYTATDILNSGGLKINDLSFGSWSQNEGWTYQDAFLVSKRDRSLRGAG